MYVSSFGISFHQHLNTKQKQARSSVLHLQELPQAEVPRTIDMGDTPLAKASATFNDLFPMGFALYQPKSQDLPLISSTTSRKDLTRVGQQQQKRLNPRMLNRK